MDKDRFQKVYSQGLVNVAEILVDTQTGVNYLYYWSGNGGGLTPLLDREGKPVITAVGGGPEGGRRPGASLSAQPWAEESENSLTTAGKSHIIHI